MPTKLLKIDGIHLEDPNVLFKLQSFRKTTQPTLSPVTYAIGDLHGNALKLLAVLLALGLVKIEFQVIDEIISLYKSLGSKYSTNRELVYDKFQKLIKEYSTVANTPIIQNTRIILLGDTLCDRGNSDVMTLLLYNFMAERGINYTIILSNHDLEFISQWRLGWHAPITVTQRDSFDIQQLSPNYKEKVKTIMEKVYWPRLKTIKLDNSKTIAYTHAPCDRDKIVTMAANLGCHATDFLSRVDHINKNFGKAMKCGLNSTQFRAYLKFVWYPQDGNIPCDPDLINVHGHIGVEDNAPISQNRISLDTDLGRDDMESRSMFSLYIYAEVHSGQQHESSSSTTVSTTSTMPGTTYGASSSAAASDPFADEIKAMIEQAFKKYEQYVKSAGWFSFHGNDGIRRAQELNRLTKEATNFDFICYLLRSFALNDITQDSEKKYIWGQVRDNPHSFISFLLNEIKNSSDIWKKLGIPQLRDYNTLDFTSSNNGYVATIRKQALAKLKNCSQSFVLQYNI